MTSSSEGSTLSVSEAFSFISSVVDSIVAENRAMLGEKSNVEIRCNIPGDLSSTCVSISNTEFSRVLSNVLNNSIEALGKKSGGIITITTASAQDRVILTVEDNGKGIPAKILHKLRSVGGSYGKSGGAGIGLHHAKATLAKADGSLSIDSVPGKGTTIRLEMPGAPLPKWCSKNLELSDAKTIVVLDDDQSMHLLWKQRLGEEGVVYLNDPEQFKVTRFPPETTRYIFDHEICGSPVTGLDLIVSNKLGDRAVLVTSYFNEPKIQRAVEDAGASMLPKFMISTVGIRRASGESAKSTAPAAPADKKLPYDVVLIDDDPLVHTMWRFAGAQQGKTVMAVASTASLDLDELDRETPIYIDKNLGQISGLTVASDLHRKGFKNISLATGENLAREAVPPFIREVRSKDFPLEA